MIVYIHNISLAILLTINLVPSIGFAQDDHNEAEHTEGAEDEHAEGEVEVEMNAAQRASSGVVIEVIEYQSLAEEIMAPGEVIVNAYKSSQVTPRISAQIANRHARLGDAVSREQVLVTLSSVEMAAAQGNLLITSQEWERVNELGREVVSERRFVEAQVAFQQAQSTVLAFGMTTPQIQTLIQLNDVTGATGEFDLLAPQDGTVISDDFVIGEVIDPGRVLFELTDESTIWVETSLTPEEAQAIESGAMAHVRIGEDWLEGSVIQSHHAVNETTRTLAVRIELPNPTEQLHPGLFVDTRIQANQLVEVLALPEEAVLRSPDGDWVIFVEDEPDRFKPVEVDVINTIQGLAVIEGVPVGTRVVTQGAFFVQSELAKSGFEIHNH